MQHERNYTDERLQKLSKNRRLDIDPTRVEFSWVMDFCAQALRNIIIGIGNQNDGYMMKSQFNITPSSELMLSLPSSATRGLAERLAISPWLSTKTRPITTNDLEVRGHDCWMHNTINLTLCSTLSTAMHGACRSLRKHRVGQSSSSAIGSDSSCSTITSLKAGLAPTSDSRSSGTSNALCQYGTQHLGSYGHHPGAQDARRRTLGLSRRSLAGCVYPREPRPAENGIPNMLHHIGIIRTAGINRLSASTSSPPTRRMSSPWSAGQREAAGARVAISEQYAKEERVPWNSPRRHRGLQREDRLSLPLPVEKKLRERVEIIARECTAPTASPGLRRLVQARCSKKIRNMPTMPLSW